MTTDSATDSVMSEPLPIVGPEAIEPPAFNRIRKNGYSWPEVDAWVSNVIEVLEQLVDIKVALDGSLVALRAAAKDPTASTPAPASVPSPLPTFDEPEFPTIRKNGYNPHEVNAWAMEAIKRCTDLTRDIEWSTREMEMLKAQVPATRKESTFLPPPAVPALEADSSSESSDASIAAEPPAPPAALWGGKPPASARPVAPSMGPPTGPPAVRPPVTNPTPLGMPQHMDDQGEGTDVQRYVIENARAEARKILDDAKHRANKIVRDVAVRTAEIRSQREAQIEADMEQARAQVTELESIVLSQRAILSEASQRFQEWRAWAVSEMERAANEFRLTPDPFADPLYAVAYSEADLVSASLGDGDEFDRTTTDDEFDWTRGDVDGGADTAAPASDGHAIDEEADVQHG